MFFLFVVHTNDVFSQDIQNNDIITFGQTEQNLQNTNIDKQKSNHNKKNKSFFDISMKYTTCKRGNPARHVGAVNSLR